MHKFLIEGGHPLQGTVTVSGSKNAVLKIIPATLLVNGICVLRNVPDIDDVQNLLKIMGEIGSKYELIDHVLTIDNRNIHTFKITSPLACKMRASIMLLAPLLVRFGEVEIPYPGGCVIGKRPVDEHLFAFEKMGVDVVSVDNKIHLKGTNLHPAKFAMPEISVTATENALMLAAGIPGISQIRLAAAEPHTQNLAHFLAQIGSQVEGIGSHSYTVHGTKEFSPTTLDIIPDFLEVATFVLAGILTKGEVRINNIIPEHLDIFWTKLSQMGAQCEVGTDFARTFGNQGGLRATNIQTGVYPKFPTDLQSPMTILLTQATGISHIFETIYENRFSYLAELEKMGVNLELMNPRQALIVGPNVLCATPVASWDLRAGTAMVLAALVAKGTTEVQNIHYIDRGYEDLEGKLKKIGAHIERVEG